MPIISRSLIRVLLPALLATAMSGVSSAALINQSITFDTPSLWAGSVQWTQPAGNSTVTLDLGPNWEVSVTEFVFGGVFSGISVNARHLATPHEPPSPLGLFLGTGFAGPPGAPPAPPSIVTQLHEDEPGHYDRLIAALVPIGAGASRLDILLEHVAQVPEPSTFGLLGLGLIAFAKLRRRSLKA